MDLNGQATEASHDLNGNIFIDNKRLCLVSQLHAVCIDFGTHINRLFKQNSSFSSANIILVTALNVSETL